jgi:hypothetical protein
LYPDVRALVEVMSGSGKIPRRGVGSFSPELFKDLQGIADSNFEL